MADTLVKLCSTSDVPENAVKAFEVGNSTLAVYNVGGEFYVTDNECTHGAASLAEGILEDDIIEWNSLTIHEGLNPSHDFDAMLLSGFRASSTHSSTNSSDF